MIIVISLTTGDFKNLPPELYIRFAAITKATGNNINDADLNGYHYFKITLHLAVTILCLFSLINLIILLIE